MNRPPRYLRLLMLVGATTSIIAATASIRTWAASSPEVHINLLDGLTPQEAVALALRRNPNFMALRKAHDLAAAGIGRATILPNPELRIGSTALDEEALGGNSNYDLSLRWSPPRPRERNLKAHWARARVSEADGEIEEAAQRLASDILFLHTKIVFLDELIATADASVRLREEIVEFVASQVKEEVKSLLDLNVAEFALADAQSLPGSYRAERELLMSRMIGELNLPTSAELKIQVEGSPLDFHPRSLNVTDLINSALRNRAELASASARCSQSQALFGLQKNELYPWFSFFQAGRRFESGSGSDSWAFRFGVDLPIFKWKSKSTLESFTATEKCQLDYESLKHRITMEVQQLADRLQARYREIERLRQAVEPITERDLELSEQAMTLGGSDRLQHLMAKARQLQRRQNYLTEILEYRRIEIELDRATGTLVDFNNGIAGK